MPTEKRERQRANREAKLAQQKKHERRARLRRTAIRWTVITVLVLAVIFVLSLRGGDDTADTTLATTTSTSVADTAAEGDATADTTLATTSTTAPVAGATDYAAFRAQPTACGGTQPDEVTTMSFEVPENQGLSGTVGALLTTSCGDIEFALDADGYPETVNSFVFLAQQGFFDGTVCHRLAAGFVLQCGDPTATGMGDAGYEIPDEFPPEDFVYGRGVVAMANAGPGTTGSQFFIVTGDASFLGPQFSVLGTVAGSEPALAALETVPLGLSPSGELSSPRETIYIESVEITG